MLRDVVYHCMKDTSLFSYFLLYGLGHLCMLDFLSAVDRHVRIRLHSPNSVSVYDAVHVQMELDSHSAALDSSHVVAQILRASLGYAKYTSAARITVYIFSVLGL